MSAAADLEGRYRRLMRMYPAEHRRKHQDEMLGVLMTGAHAGQRRPGPADTANLVWGALLIRLRPARPGTAWPLWRDALAVVSVVLPLVFLAYEIVSVTTVLTPQPVTQVAFIGFAQELLVGAGAWAVLTALVLLRLRRVVRRAVCFCCPRYGLVAEASGTIASCLSTRGHRDARRRAGASGVQGRADPQGSRRCRQTKPTWAYPRRCSARPVAGR